jgi:hypothetical protein
MINAGGNPEDLSINPLSFQDLLVLFISLTCIICYETRSGRTKIPI